MFSEKTKHISNIVLKNKRHILNTDMYTWISIHPLKMVCQVKLCELGILQS